MGTFISDPGSTLPPSTIGTKEDKRSVPVGAEAKHYTRAADINEHTARIDAAHSALLDVRTAVLADEVTLAGKLDTTDDGSALSILPTGAVTPRTAADVAAASVLAASRDAPLLSIRRPDLTLAHAEPAASFAATPVPYFGNELVHPSIHFNPAGWNGYRYWLAITPYAATDSQYENPSIYCSHDGQAWVTPAGLTNPVIPWPGGISFNSDPELVDGLDGRLYLFYRLSDGGTTSKIMVSSSANGRDWSAPVESLSLLVASEVAASPGIIYDGKTWTMFYVDTVTKEIRKRTATSPFGPWSAASAVTIAAAPAGMEHWHLAARNVGGRIVLLIQVGAVGASGGNGDLYLAWSDDGDVFTRGVTPVLAHDGFDRGGGVWNLGIYRSTFLPVHDGYETRLGIWYTGVSATYGWRFGYTEARLGARDVSGVIATHDAQRDRVTRMIAGAEAALSADSFTRTDSTLAIGSPEVGSPWIVGAGAFGVAAGALYQPTGANSKAYVETLAADVHVTAQMSVLGPDQWLMVRVQDANNYLRIGATSTNRRWRCERIVGGAVNATPWTGPAISAAGDWLEVVTSGSTIAVLVNGAQVGQFTDATVQTATRHGVQTGNATTRIGAFAVWSDSSSQSAVRRQVEAFGARDIRVLRALAQTGGGIVADAFARPDSTTGLGATRGGLPWVAASGTVGISSRRAYAPAAANNIAVVDAGAADVDIGVQLQAGTGAYLLFRYVDTSNFFRLGCTSGGVYALERVQGGAATSLASGIGTAVAGDWLEVSTSGSTIRAWINGRLVFNGIDAFQSTETKHGMQIAVTSARLGGFYVGSESPLEVTTVPAQIIVSPAAPPTASADYRGVVWVQTGGAGVKDTVQVCAKDAADAYAWRGIY